MKNLSDTNSSHLSRREAITRVATGLGVASIFRQDAIAASGWAQNQTASASTQNTVQTVLGPLDVSRLGFTLSHEHVAATSAGFFDAWPEYFGGRAQFITATVEKLKEAKSEGVDTFIDVSTFDLGRNIRLIEEVSRKSGVQIVACTGHWVDSSFSMNARTHKELEDFFVREIEEGMEGTDIRAGAIKVATGAPEISEFEEKVLRAAARASKTTGAPITTHASSNDRMGEKQAAIFEDEGLSPSKVCIGHSDDNSDVSYTMDLAKRGYYVSMDHVSRGNPEMTFENRLSLVKGLVDAGLADKVFLGNDWAFGFSLMSTGSSPSTGNTDGILFVTRNALPALREMGVSDDNIRTIMVDAPRQFFS